MKKIREIIVKINGSDIIEEDEYRYFCRFDDTMRFKRVKDVIKFLEKYKKQLEAETE